jgi:hypothetical protein
MSILELQVKSAKLGLGYFGWSFLASNRMSCITYGSVALRLTSTLRARAADREQDQSEQISV